MLITPVFNGHKRSDRDAMSHFFYQYLTMWYNSCLSFMMVEINARSGIQIYIMVPIYILNQIINAILFGVFVDAGMKIREKESAVQELLDNSNQVMIEQDIAKTDEQLVSDVREFLLKTAYYKMHSDELKGFLDESVNPKLRSQII